MPPLKGISRVKIVRKQTSFGHNGTLISKFRIEINIFFSLNRAIITGIYDFDTVEVFYVDYGTNSKVLLNHCRFLDKRFGQAKAQAINVKCGGIKPKESIKGNFDSLGYQRDNFYMPGMARGM